MGKKFIEIIKKKWLQSIALTILLYDKTLFLTQICMIQFQDVVKFEYDKTITIEQKNKFAFQDVVKFEYDK